MRLLLAIFLPFAVFFTIGRPSERCTRCANTRPMKKSAMRWAKGNKQVV